ncbi:pretoxin HINT domain protein [Leptospira licerasiae serovar Varillal str. VAR 010]|nr:pretoxin HINT domain protein [Leptospira licerasiae serovar Varillal str. VAR 010]
MPTGAYQSSQWDSLFQQAYYLSDVATWDQLVGEGFSYFWSDWENQSNIEFANILSTITNSDAIAGNQGYLDYVTSYLQMEQQQAAKDWENQAIYRIEQERSYFLASLQNSQVDTLTTQSPVSNTSESLALNSWNQKFQENTQVGMYEFQQALKDLQTEFTGLQNSLASTDAQFQQNFQQIQAIENQVRQSVANSADGLKSYLLQQSLLHLTDASGNSLLGDFSGMDSTQLLAAYNTIDASKLNTAGVKLKNLIDTISTALDPTNPASLADIASEMQDYLEVQKDYASTQALAARAAEYQNWTFGDGGTSVIRYAPSTMYNGIYSSAGFQDNQAGHLGSAVADYLAGNAANLITQLNGLLGNPNLTVSQVYSMDLVASSSAAYINQYWMWNIDFLDPYDYEQGSLSQDGPNYYTLQAKYYGCWGGICVPAYEWKYEEWVYAQGSVQVHDAAQQANAELFEGYLADINLQLGDWQNTLMPAINSWEQQVSDYQARYSEWQTKKLDLQNQINTQYQTQVQELYQNREEWLTNLSNLYSDANAASSGAAVLPTFSSNVSNSSAASLASLSNELSSFQADAAKAPDASKVSGFYDNIGTVMNGAYNLSIVETQQIAALDAQKSSVNNLIKSLEAQREMNSSDISEEVYAKFTGKTFTGADATGKIEGAGLCVGDNYKTNQSTCDALYNDDKNFKLKYSDVYVDDKGTIHAVQNVKTGQAVFQGGDATNSESYELTETSINVTLGNVGTVKLADTKNLGGVFKSNWYSNENSEALSSYMQSSYTNRTDAYISNGLMNAISLNASAADDYAGVMNTRAQNSAVAQASAASTAMSIAQTLLTGGSGMDWAKQQVKEMTKSAVATGISKATGIPADVISAFIDYKADQKAKKKAQQAMDQRMMIISPGLYVLSQVPGVRDVVRPINNIIQKGVSEAIVGATKVTAEVVHGVTSVLGKDGAKAILGLTLGPAGFVINTSDIDKLDDKIRDLGKESAEYIRGKDLQADLAKGDIQAKWKADIKTAAYNQVAEQFAPPGMDPQIFSQLWQEFDKRQAAKAAKKEQQKQMVSTALQIAASVALQFIPGPGTVAGGSMLASAIASVGSTVSSVVSAIGSAISTVGTWVANAATWVANLPGVSSVVSAVSTAYNAVANFIAPAVNIAKTAITTVSNTVGSFFTSGGTQAATNVLTTAQQNYIAGVRFLGAAGQAAIASSSGNDNATLSAFANGMLLGATGPMGLAGSVSYTPPQKANTLGGMLDEGLNGPSASGWGGGLNVGGSAFNGGISFVPGSGLNLNFGGTVGDAGGFYNLSYNLESGNTSGSIGAGQEYGSNFGVNLSTDNDQKPSIFMGFGCDMGENNCGGGAANKLGLGGSLTINADGTVDLGADILGNQALGISFDSNSNSWGPITANTNFGNDYTVMTAQNLADKAQREAQMKIAGTYGDVLKDPNLIANSESLKAIADSYGVKPENLPEVIQNLSDTVRNPDADPNLRQSALASLTEMMGSVHNEAYVDGNKGLKDAIDKSPAIAEIKVQGKDQHGSAEDGIFSQVGEQAKIYLNQIAGNAFGDFAYINDNGEVVFRSCFVAGTLVWTKDGQRPIETIKVGDIVLSWDEESGQNEYRAVTETFVNQTTTILKITYADGTAIETTWNHPFYLQQGLWVHAKDLMAGDLSVTADGKVATVASVVEIIRNDTVYNFEVEDNHTYFVSKAGVLVHNYLDQVKPFLDNFKDALTFINQESLKAVSTINEDIKKATEQKKIYSDLIDNVNITASERAAYNKEINKLNETIKSRTNDLNQRAKEIDMAITFRNKSDELLNQTQYTEFLKTQLEGNENLTPAEKAVYNKTLAEQIAKVKKLKAEVQAAFSSVSQRFAGEANRFLDANLKYTGPFAFLNENTATVNAGNSLLSNSPAFNEKNTIVNADGFATKLDKTTTNIIKDFKDKYTGDPSKMPDITKVLDRTYERPNIDYKRMKNDPAYSESVMKKLADPLYGAQYGRKGTILQLEVVMGTMKQVYPTKEKFLEKALVRKVGESDNEYVTRQTRMEGIASWMYDGSKTIKVVDSEATYMKKLESGAITLDPSMIVYKEEVVPKSDNDLASGIASATCRIYANWLQAVLSQKTNLSFGEFYSSKLMEGDIGMGQQTVAPVLDLGGTPGFDNSYGAPEIGGGAHNFSSLSLSLFGGLLGPNKFTEFLGQFIDMPNPIPFDTLTQKLDNYKEGDVVQIWVDNSNPPGPNHFCLIKKTAEGWINYNHNGNLGRVEFGKVIKPEDLQDTKIYKVYGPNN